MSYIIPVYTQWPVTIPDASSTQDGVMSAADKIKLDGLSSGFVTYPAASAVDQWSLLKIVDTGGNSTYAMLAITDDPTLFVAVAHNAAAMGDDVEGITQLGAPTIMLTDGAVPIAIGNPITPSTVTAGRVALGDTTNIIGIAVTSAGATPDEELEVL